MRFHLAPSPLLHLLTTILLTTTPFTTAKPRPAPSLQAGFDFNELIARYECSGELCGWNDQLCCSAGSGCYTNALQQATCTGYGGYSSAAPAASSVVYNGGHWELYTTIYTVTDREIVTSVYSTYVGSVSAAASAYPSGGVRCNFALNESQCGGICCAGNQYCKYPGQCAAAAATETTVTTTGPAALTPGAPIRPTSSGVVVVTHTQQPTTTVPFTPPVATGANVTMTETHGGGGGGLSGGAIAGIVIGVLIGLAILGLICFYCCLKGLLDGCLALFGLGGRKKRRTSVEETYERRSHHGGGGRTWYGASRPSRVERRDSSHTGRNVMGGLAGLAGLWAILGLKRQRKERKNAEKRSEYSYSSEYYTSSSSASSDDRRTRYTSRSRR